MLVDIEKEEQLKVLHKKTGKPIKDLANEIINLHLDEKKKTAYLKQELDTLLALYKERQRNLM